MRRNMPICYLTAMHGLNVEEFYRQIHTGNPGDVDFYTRLLNREDSALELGCGWGRMTGPLSKKSRRIVGLDDSEIFCEMARENLESLENARIIRHDVRQPWQGSEAERRIGEELGKFDRIFAPYNFLYALGGEPGVARALDLVATHLRDDGEFWCDVYPMDEFQAALDEGEVTQDDDDEPVATFTWQGRSYPVIETSSLDPTTQSLHVTYRALEHTGGRCVFESSLEHHYLLIPQLSRLLEGAGLQISLLLGDFDGRPYDENATQLVLCAERS